MSGLVTLLPFALVALIAAMLVAWPLLRRRDRIGKTADAVSVDVAARRARLRELDAERRAGLIDEAAYREARTEAERELLEALEQAEGEQGTAPSGGRAGGGRRLVLLAAAAVPVLAGGIYLQVGSPELLAGGIGTTAPRDAAEAAAQIEAGLPELEQRVEERPADIQAWVMLTRAYQLLERPEEAAAAAARGIEENGDIPALLVERARALAADRGRFGAEATALLERALARAPAHPDALWFRGLAALQGGDMASARRYWLTLRPQLAADPEAAARLDDLIARLPAGEGAEEGPGPLTVTVDVDDALAIDLPAHTPVFVYARDAERGGPPLAAVRTTLGELPARLRLDDAMARATGRTLADAARLEVVARVSLAGDPRPAEGDYEGVTTLSRTDAVDGVTVTVDSRL